MNSTMSTEFEDGKPHGNNVLATMKQTMLDRAVSIDPNYVEFRIRLRRTIKIWCRHRNTCSKSSEPSWILQFGKQLCKCL